MILSSKQFNTLQVTVLKYINRIESVKNQTTVNLREKITKLSLYERLLLVHAVLILGNYGIDKDAPQLFLPRKVGMPYIGLSLTCELIFFIFTRFLLGRPLRAVKAQIFYDQQNT